MKPLQENLDFFLIRASRGPFHLKHKTQDYSYQKELLNFTLGFPGGSEVKVSACNAGDRVQSLGREDSLEKEMATHSSILAWRIPWTQEPGGLQSMGSQRVGHD